MVSTSEKKQIRPLSEELHERWQKSGLSIYELQMRTRADRDNERSGLRYATVWNWCTKRNKANSRTLDLLGRALKVRIRED